MSEYNRLGKFSGNYEMFVISSQDFHGKNSPINSLKKVDWTNTLHLYSK